MLTDFEDDLHLHNVVIRCKSVFLFFNSVLITLLR